jgi:hypothetical protein
LIRLQLSSLQTPFRYVSRGRVVEKARFTTKDGQVFVEWENQIFTAKIELIDASTQCRQPLKVITIWVDFGLAPAAQQFSAGASNIWVTVVN